MEEDTDMNLDKALAKDPNSEKSKLIRETLNLKDEQNIKGRYEDEDEEMGPENV